MKTNRHINVMIPLGSYEQLKSTAAKLAAKTPGKNMTVSEVVRRAIESYLKKKGE